MPNMPQISAQISSAQESAMEEPVNYQMFIPVAFVSQEYAEKLNLRLVLLPQIVFLDSVSISSAVKQQILRPARLQTTVSILIAMLLAFVARI